MTTKTGKPTRKEIQQALKRYDATGWDSIAMLKAANECCVLLARVLEVGCASAPVSDSERVTPERSAEDIQQSVSVPADAPLSEHPVEEPSQQEATNDTTDTDDRGDGTDPLLPSTRLGLDWGCGVSIDEIVGFTACWRDCGHAGRCRKPQGHEGPCAPFPYAPSVTARASASSSPPPSVAQARETHIKAMEAYGRILFAEEGRGVAESWKEVLVSLDRLIAAVRAESHDALWKLRDDVARLSDTVIGQDALAVPRG